MSRTSSLTALQASPPAITGFAAGARPFEGGVEPLLARGLAAVGDCARMAWWDGSAVGLHLNGLLGLFEAEAQGRGRGWGRGWGRT